MTTDLEHQQPIMAQGDASMAGMSEQPPPSYYQAVFGRRSSKKTSSDRACICFLASVFISFLAGFMIAAILMMEISPQKVFSPSSKPRNDTSYQSQVQDSLLRAEFWR